LKLRRIQWIRVVLALAVVLAAPSCAKKKPTPPTPVPPPPAPAPTAMLTANPNTITAGQAATLTWTTDFATSVTIDDIGKVDPSGSMKVTPTESTTYHLVAKNDTGTKEATARITVTPAAAPPPTSSSTGNESDARMFSQNVKDVFFDYDSYDISSQAQATIQSDARFLQQHPSMNFVLEGHCDERGSIEYNLALGENRAQATKTALVQAGIAATRMRTVTYGKEKPFCTESTESCWQQNRRAHFAYSK
jgi:peptidoglycan-associated lipoprotein